MSALKVHTDPKNEQLSLPFAEERWPKRPYCKAEKSDSPRIRTLKHARRFPYIQPNAPTVVFRLVFDIDRRGAILAWEDANLAIPNWIAENPKNGHVHTVYELEIPIAVAANDQLNTKPMRLAAAIETAYRVALGADPAFAGHYVKNPGHKQWRTTFYRTERYDLWELSEWVDLPRRLDMRCKPDLSAVAGRNCYLFERLSRWSYRAVRDFWRPGGFEAFHRAVEAYAEQINDEIEAEFPGRGPLGFPEMRHTVKSVANWTWSHLTPQGFREWCSRRGKKSGEVRRKATEKQRKSARRKRTDGMSIRAIAAELGVARSTISDWVSGEPYQDQPVRGRD